MRLWLVIGLLFATTSAFADVSVVASVDRNHIAFGESVTMTISVQGTQSGAQPSIPRVDGLSFEGPSTQSSFSFGNGQASQSISFVYQVTPARTGEFIIPALQVSVGGRNYSSAPIRLIVEKGTVQNSSNQTLFAQIRLPSQQLYLGQTEPAQVILYSRADVPLKGVGGFNYEADGLGYKFLPNLKSGSQVINGVSFNALVIDGSISPSRTAAWSRSWSTSRRGSSSAMPGIPPRTPP